MKAENLMIGDYVQTEGKSIMVDAVHQKKVGWHNQQDRLSWVREGLLEPIPLTAEILKNNGFKRDGGASIGYYGKYTLVLMHWSEDRMQFVISDDRPGWVLKLDISYVHELQQALRLCRIPMKIELP